jgi:hypothetical protein
MLRAFSAFLLVFWLLGLTVHLDGLVHLFGIAALVLFAMDLLMRRPESRPRVSRARGETLL